MSVPAIGLPDPTLDGCCAKMDPCTALCELENAEIQLATGKKTASYEIGDEKFTVRLPSLKDIRCLIEIYERRCAKSRGQRCRGGGGFVFADPRCKICRASRCRCR